MGFLLAFRGMIAFIPAFIWKWLAIVLIGVVIFFAGDVRGRRIEHAKNQAAIDAANAAAKQQDTQAQTEVNTQDAQVTQQLQEQKKADEDAIEDLKRQLEASRDAEQKAYQSAEAERGKKPTAKAPRCPPTPACVYDKSNGDPERSGSDSVRDNGKSGSGARHKKPAKSSVLPATGGRAASSGGQFAVCGVGTTQAGRCSS